MKSLLTFVLTILFFAPVLQAQVLGENELDESKLYASTKQVNQFFRRFNGEEDEKGNRFYPGDKKYRDVKLRKKYLEILFDEANAGMTASQKSDFLKSVLDKATPQVLDFHQPGWFCEVHTSFAYKGKSVPVTLFMELERAQLGSKWVIKKVYSEIFETAFKRDTTRVGKFLHPMSHELEFMNLHKAFQADSVSQFASKTFVPDHLSLFLYEMSRGNLKFESVIDQKFHFLQIDGWYFELSQFNRAGYNTGWLISILVKLNAESDKAVMRKYIYHENR